MDAIYLSVEITRGYVYDIEDNELPKYDNYNLLTTGKCLFFKINLNLSLPFYQLFHGNLENEKKKIRLKVISDPRFE